MDSSSRGIVARSARRWPAYAMGLLAILLWAVPFLAFIPHDYWAYLSWYQEVLAEGRIGAFAEPPLINYAPPYLYVLSAGTLLDSLLGPLLVIRLVSVLGAVWLAFAIFALLKAAGADDYGKAAVWSFLLPTVVINVPILMQADGYWVAPCLLAVTAALKGDTIRTAFWAGVGFAFKAQAIFIAPFVIAVLASHWRPRQVWHWAIPLAVYCAAMFPAWLVGWPAADLATIYLKQASWTPPGQPAFVSNASNWWLVFKIIDLELAARSFWAGFALAALATGAYWYAIIRRQLDPAGLIAVAALSAGMLPWLLPSMHERFFALAEILTFCLAWQSRDRQAIAIAILMQVALILSFGGWFFDFDPAPVAGALMMTAALALLIRRIALLPAGTSTMEQRRNSDSGAARR